MKGPRESSLNNLRGSELEYNYEDSSKILSIKSFFIERIIIKKSSCASIKFQNPMNLIEVIKGGITFKFVKITTVIT